MPTTDVLVVGGVGVDTTVLVEELPLSLRDVHIVPPVHDYVGHTGNGVAQGCRLLGLGVELVDVIGDDPQGQFVRAAYEAQGMNFSYVVHPSGTRRSVNLVDPEGRRMALYDPRHPADVIVPVPFVRPFLERTRHVHLSIMNWRVAC